MNRIDFQNEPPSDECAQCLDCEWHIYYEAEDSARAHVEETGHSVDVTLEYNSRFTKANLDKVIKDAA